MSELSKQKLVNLLRSASLNDAIKQYRYKPDYPGAEEIRLADVLEQASTKLDMYMPDDSEPVQKSFRSIMGVGTTFKVEKPFVYKKIQFKVDDRIEVIQFDTYATRILHVGADPNEKAIHDIGCDFMDLDEMYDNHFITKVK